jgi:hypothetical protein
MAETLSKDSKVVVFDSGVTLDDANVNNVKQGVTVGDLNGFVKVKTTAGAPATGAIGEIVYNTADNKLYICDAANTFLSVTLA